MRLPGREMLEGAGRVDEQTPRGIAAMPRRKVIVAGLVRLPGAKWAHDQARPACIQAWRPFSGNPQRRCSLLGELT